MSRFVAGLPERSVPPLRLSVGESVEGELVVVETVGTVCPVLVGTVPSSVTVLSPESSCPRTSVSVSCIFWSMCLSSVAGCVVVWPSRLSTRGSVARRAVPWWCRGVGVPVVGLLESPDVEGHRCMYVWPENVLYLVDAVARPS